MGVLAGREDAQLLGNVSNAHGSDINDAIFIDSDSLVTCSSDKTVKLWRNVHVIENDKKILSSTLIDQRQYAIYAMDLSLGKNLLVVSSMDGGVKIWDLKDWNLLATIVPPGQAAIRTCRISPNSNLLVIAGDDDMAHIFDLDDPKHKLLRSCKGHEATIFLACFSHDSSHLITGDNDGVILVWNNLDYDQRFGIGNKSCYRVDDAHDLGVTTGDCLPDKDGNFSTMVTGGNDSLLKVWKLWNKGKNSGQMENIKTLSGHGGNIMSVKFAKNGRIFVSTSGDKTLRIWHAANLNCLR